MAAIGDVDEANCAIGLAISALSPGELAERLRSIQNELFDLGADLATPFGTEFEANALRIVARQVERLEEEIDAMNASLEPLRSFILPGGSTAVSLLHLARAIVRRAERGAVALHELTPVNSHALSYLNRLSDHLFVAARHLAAGEGGDVLWKPGATRDS
jgi:cob(I)alamin adenosyltransferase